MKNTRAVAVILAAGLVLNFVSQAQTEVEIDATETAARSATNLQPLADEDVPRVGTFYCLMDSRMPARRLLAPLPFPPSYGVVYLAGRPDVFVVDCRATPRADTELAAAIITVKVRCAAAALALADDESVAAMSVLEMTAFSSNGLDSDGTPAMLYSSSDL
jgi:hypothetical protein